MTSGALADWLRSAHSRLWRRAGPAPPGRDHCPRVRRWRWPVFRARLLRAGLPSISQQAELLSLSYGEAATQQCRGNVTLPTRRRGATPAAPCNPRRSQSGSARRAGSAPAAAAILLGQSERERAEPGGRGLSLRLCGPRGRALAVLR
ncbi:hypothetical protein ACRRTK_011966 [Alexandromys fortis]